MRNTFEDIVEECEAAGQLNFLPFKIEYDGKANVETEFNSRAQRTPPDQQADDLVQIEFRGRPLQGQKLRLPQNYKGFVGVDLKSSSNVQSGEEDNEKCIRLTSTFDSFTYWNWDKPPSAMDLPHKLFDWLAISEILHEPIHQIDKDQENCGNKTSHKSN